MFTLVHCKPLPKMNIPLASVSKKEPPLIKWFGFPILYRIKVPHVGTAYKTLIKKGV